MRTFFYTFFFIIFSLFVHSQTLQTNIIVEREDSIESQLNGTFQYTIIQLEDTFKVVSKLDTNEFVIFRFEADIFGDYDLGDTKLVVSTIKERSISKGNTDNYLKKIFEISKVENTKIGLQVKPPKIKFKITKEVYDGVEIAIIEDSYEGVSEYISFSVFNNKNEVSFKEY